VKTDVEKPKYISLDADLRRRINLERFAVDLAKELGGTLLPADVERKTYQKISIGPDVLELYANDWKQRVTASISAPDVAWGDWSTYDKAQRTDEASVNPDGRSIAAIAKDIKKRVIDANLPALAARRAYAEQQKQNRAGLAAKAQALAAACPTLSIKVNERDQVATIWSRSSVYLDGSMSPTGLVNIQRIGGVSTEAFVKILAILENDSAKEKD
jgi:hypothetical protein